MLDACSEVGSLTASFGDEQEFTWRIGSHDQMYHFRYFEDAMISLLVKNG
jgi:hypothetical protein